MQDEFCLVLEMMALLESTVACVLSGQLLLVAAWKWLFIILLQLRSCRHRKMNGLAVFVIILRPQDKEITCS